MSKFISSFLILISLQLQVLACSCDDNGPFLKVAKTSKLVALVQVKQFLTYKNISGKEIPMSMEVEVVEIYKGVETRKTITVWGDNGILCRPYLNKFDVGKFYLIAFSSTAETSRGIGNDGEKPDDYSISICGEYSLLFDKIKNTAFGNVSVNQNSMELQQLKSFFIESK